MLRVSVFLITTLLMSLPNEGEAQQIGDPDCSELLLVSSFRSDNVKIYNACDGSFVRDLDSQDTLEGVLAVVEGPSGDIYVASEGNDRIVRYARDSLTLDRIVSGDDPQTEEFEFAAVLSPSGLAFTDDGKFYAAGFGFSQLVEVDLSTGARLRVVADANDGLSGPDAGLGVVGNILLIPNFNNNSVTRVDTETGASSVLIPAAEAGLNAPRTVIVQESGDLLVSSWRGNRILEFSGAGEFIRTVTDATARPTGMTLDSDGSLLVTSDASDDVKRIDLSNGEVLETLIDGGAGGLSGGTAILRIQKQGADSAGSVTRQFWLIGVGAISDRRIVVDQMNFTSGAAFGNDFDPDAVSLGAWGRVELDFDSCDSAQMSWNADQAPAYESGDYAVFRLAASPLSRACAEIGFENLVDNVWMSGHWFGGGPRDGEGMSIDIIDGDRAIVTWYSYLADSVQ